MVESSFYSDTPNYAEDIPAQNDGNTNPVTGNTVAPSSFYQGGSAYSTDIGAPSTSDPSGPSQAPVSFYGSAANYAASLPAQNDSNTNPLLGNSAAPSSFYPNGQNYSEADAAAAYNFYTASQAAADAALASQNAAHTSEVNAATSAAGAASSKASADADAASALASKNAAATSETNAASSASTATTQAGTATTKASQAATSATNAATSESNAAGSASAAAGSASAAATSASNAAATLAGAVRHDISQSLTTTAQTQAQRNIGTGWARATSADLNTIKDPGLYDGNGGGGNYPVADYCYVDVMRHSGFATGTNEYTFQTAYRLTSTAPQMWIRAQTQGAGFGAWEQVMTGNNNLSEVTNTATARFNIGAVAKAGDTMTGDLAISKANPALNLTKSASGQHNAIVGSNAGNTRWYMSLGDTNAESGGNLGSDFSLYRYTDAGAFIGTALQVIRSTGQVNIGGAVNTGGEITVTGSASKFRLNDGTYGTMLYNDGSSFYILLTPAGSPLGTFNGLRPFFINQSNGNVFMNHVVTVGALTAGSVHVDGNLASTGTVTRQGVAAAGWGSSTFNTFWTGSALQCWVDSTMVGNFGFVSDYRVKKDVTDLTGSALDEINKWRLITYTGADYGIFKANDDVRASFLAHQLKAISPDCVSGEKDGDNIQTLEIVPIIARMAKAIQELDAQNKALQQDVKQLQAALQNGNGPPPK